MLDCISTVTVHGKCTQKKTGFNNPAFYKNSNSTEFFAKVCLFTTWMGSESFEKCNEPKYPIRHS